MVLTDPTNAEVIIQLMSVFFSLESFHLGVLFFCGINTLIAYGAFAESLVHWQGSRVSAVLAIAPIITLVFGQLMSTVVPGFIPPEQLTPIGIVGAFVVVYGSVNIALKNSD